MVGKKHQRAPESEEVTTLIQRQTKVINHIKNIHESIKSRTTSFNPFEIECRLDILKQHIDQATQYQSELEILDPSNDERSELEDLCVTTKAMMLSIQAKQRNADTQESSLCAPAYHSKLPNMRLPKFTGKYSDYKNFMSLFENLVHNDSTLTDIEKFNHLISCLSEEALGTVKAFQISAENYPKALASLKKVYDNECLIFFDNISNLFDLPQITKPSAAALRTMIDTVSAIYDSLLSIGDDKKITNAILIHLVMSKVDSVTKSKWEEQLDFERLPLWSECESALNKRYQLISADESSSSRSKPFKTKNEIVTKKNSKTSLTCFKPKPSCVKCLFCKSSQHTIYNCPSFSTEPVQTRFEFIKSVPACINCLKKGHTVARCNSQKCRVCNASHNTLLHRFGNNSKNTSVNQTPGNSLDSSGNMSQLPPCQVSVNCSTSDENVILATALVKVRSSSGSYILARALLDSGSQPNLITEELAQRLRVKREGGRLNLNGIGETISSAKSSIEISVVSRVNSSQFSSKFWVLSSITNSQPDHIICTSDWQIPENIELADPYFYTPQKVDLLIGAEVFFELLCVGQIKSNSKTPVLQKTLLGWIVAGKYAQTKGSQQTACHVGNVIENYKTVDEIVRKFWELEDFPKDSLVLYSEEQQKCEDTFKKSTHRLSSGRFKVSLPFKSDPNLLGSSYESAKRRFLALERKLSKNSDMREMYKKFMQEYSDLGHMSIAGSKILNCPHYFIPQQCVLRPQSLTTKLRVVFDASSRTSSQMSLNDMLMVGPTIQENLYSLLIRFRLHKFVITADIEKMYRQVLVDENDRNFQLILWRQTPADPLQIFRLNTLTYGTSSAPYLAIRCLVELSRLYIETLPIGANVIRSDFYVDDLLTGSDSLEELFRIQEQVTRILSSAGFNLTKWVSNHPNFNVSDCEEKLLDSVAECTKALGIHWIPKRDVFKFRLEENFQNLKATKRNILSAAARLFDPLGLLCPIVTKSKILLQELWIQKLDWDESIPLRLNNIWEDFKTTLMSIDAIEIPRFVNTTAMAKVQIHGFSDASIRAYGCCIYVRCSNSNGVTCRLLTAKSKVAPLKTKSLPRLELCAAHVLAKLWSKVRNMMKYDIENVTFWTDSEITLHWIKTHPSLLTTFVSNRVSEIQEWSDRVDWRHVPTKENPADIVSRGCNVCELNNSRSAVSFKERYRMANK